MRVVSSRAVVLWMALTCAGAALHAQATSALPEDWFDADEWHLQVRPIVTIAELAAYRAVTTEKQRTDFIEAFWKRRDANPRTPRNEYRDEFERRVAFANQHFTDPALAPHPGFETDRGRVYVLFGPPGSVHSAPGGSRETWTYAKDADPLSRHFLTCRMFETDGMMFTHQLPSGAYRFTSTIQWLDGASSHDAVVFRVP